MRATQIAFLLLSLGLLASAQTSTSGEVCVVSCPSSACACCKRNCFKLRCTQNGCTNFPLVLRFFSSHTKATTTGGTGLGFGLIDGVDLSSLGWDDSTIGQGVDQLQKVRVREKNEQGVLNCSKQGKQEAFCRPPVSFTVSVRVHIKRTRQAVLLLSKSVH